MFLDPHAFSFAADLEANWQAIRAEMEALEEDSFTDWQGTYVKLDGKWMLYGLFTPGLRWNENCRRCPTTAAVCERIPGITTAGFSRLTAGSHISPHRGECGAILRMHLGLTVPGDCRFRVGQVTTEWQEGKTLFFDDTLEHECFNDSDRDRTVLIIDFYRPWRYRKSAVSFVKDRMRYQRTQRNAVARKRLIEITTAKGP